MVLRSEIIERILRKRGIEGIEGFLDPRIDGLAKPEELPGIAEAAGVLLGAIAEKRQIVVFGDYDCDGVCATAILMKTLGALGADVEAFLPERLAEGYGMSDASVTRMLKEFPGVGLVVTVDNGINCVEQIARLVEKGVEVVITDHHLPGETLPAAKAIVNPKVAAPEKLSNICGAVVAFLLASRLVTDAKASGVYDGPNFGGPLLVLAGIATVTDIMPLLGQNRILVAEALKRFRSWAPVGLKELYTRAARMGADRITSKDFGFLLGPRINAAGRMASGMQALELIVTDDREITRELARIVDGYNVDRKTVEQKMTDEALAKVVEGAASQVIDLPDGHPGVAGIVAARIMERLGGDKPVCVIAGGHGSARSPEWLNIRDAFVACDDYLTNYGGHAAAGGFSVRPGKTDAFREKLDAYCRTMRPTQDADAPAKGRIEPDAWIEYRDISLELAEAVQTMEPFGEGNPEPTLGIRNVLIQDVKALGQDGRHLAITMKGGFRGVWWTHGDDVERIRALVMVPVDMIFTAVVSDYGERHIEFRTVDIKPSATE